VRCRPGLGCRPGLCVDRGTSTRAPLRVADAAGTGSRAGARRLSAPSRCGGPTHRGGAAGRLCRPAVDHSGARLREQAARCPRLAIRRSPWTRPSPSPARSTATSHSDALPSGRRNLARSRPTRV